MARKFDGPEIQESFCRVFGIEPKEITPAQVFLMVKIIKSCRTYCRSNVALYNMLKRSFPALDISTVKVASKYGPGTYDALKISNPAQPDAGPGAFNVGVEDDDGE